MGLFKDHEKEETDQGEWQVYGTDPDTKKVVRFCLRVMPDTVARAIHRRHFGNKGEINHDRHGNQVIKTDREKNVAYVIDKAVWIATASENFEGQAGDEAAAEAYTKLFGEPVTPSKDFLVDPHFGKREVRLRLLERNSDIVNWIFTKHEEMKKRVVQAEEDLAKN